MPAVPISDPLQAYLQRLFDVHLFIFERHRLFGFAKLSIELKLPPKFCRLFCFIILLNFKGDFNIAPV